MPNVPARQRPTAGLLVAVAATLGLVLGFATTGGTSTAEAQTSPAPVNTIVVRLTGQMTMKLDKAFIKTLKRSGATVQAKSGATYASKKRLVTMPVDSTSAVTFEPPATDIVAKGSLAFRRKDKRNVTTTALSLRIRPAGADVGGTVRSRSGRAFAALTISPSTKVAQTASGASFVDLQMLVSPDLARAARQAKLKGVKEGALLGLLTVQVNADIPTFQLPTITIPGFDPSQIPNLIGTTPGITIPPNITLPPDITIPGLDGITLPSIPGLTS